MSKYHQMICNSILPPSAFYIVLTCYDPQAKSVCSAKCLHNVRIIAGRLASACQDQTKNARQLARFEWIANCLPKTKHCLYYRHNIRARTEYSINGLQTRIHVRFSLTEAEMSMSASLTCRGMMYLSSSLPNVPHATDVCNTRMSFGEKQLAGVKRSFSQTDHYPAGIASLERATPWCTFDCTVLRATSLRNLTDRAFSLYRSLNSKNNQKQKITISNLAVYRMG